MAAIGSSQDRGQLDLVMAHPEFRNGVLASIGAGHPLRVREAAIEKPIVPIAEAQYLELEHLVASERGAKPRVSLREALDALGLSLRIRDPALTSARKRS